MSFILDALKKSEQERRQGEVPGLRDESPAPTSRNGSLWLVLLATALLVNGAVLGWWLSSRQNPNETAGVTMQSRTVSPQAQTPPISDGEGGSVPIAGPEPVPEGKSEASFVSSRPNEKQVGRPVSTPVSLRVDDEESSTAAQLPDISAEPEQPEAKPAIERGPEKSITETAAAPKTSDRIDGGTPGETRGVLPVTVEDGAAESAVAEQVFPSLAELAAPVRARLPELSLQLHFFTSDPERRLIRLNGTNLREGQKAGEIAVIGIDSDGVRLLCKGTRVFLPAGG